MKPFMDENFLLQTETARILYHEHAKNMPIIDYHCHLEPKMIAEDYRFRSITELWLGGDHYKWRAERTNGIDEKYITGDASDWEKFEKWAETVPYTLRNPLYHWTHLELKTAFGISKPLNPISAKEIYDACNEKLATKEFSARGLMRHYHVEIVCTTDDPADTLEYHKAIKASGFEIKVLPTWRPDKAMAVGNSKSYRAYIERLSKVSGVNISTYNDLIEALRKRQEYFALQGCKLADHGINYFPWAICSTAETNQLFQRILDGKALNSEEIEKLQTSLLLDFARMNAEKGWVQQFHYGAQRNNNTIMFNALGPDTGYDSILSYNCSQSMARFLDTLNTESRLTKTILYNLNPTDNAVVATMLGNFQDGSFPGKIQFGSGWWFNDQIDGMEKQMNDLSLLGLLSRFVGMLTDSRSFLSYPRHEYFRRVLCNLLGNDIENGLIPESEMPRVYQMVEDISYNNAKNYFNF
ncbi:glucuronate isomerase [Bacteroidaceae bacterium 14-104]|nr:glucuronate isomerase [Phocaeicola oris]MCE2616058.1 glucuronate isomerase [Phocaeicola oris]